jgi:hypothetical protein
MRILWLVFAALVPGSAALRAQALPDRLVLDSDWRTGTRLELVLEEEQIDDGVSWGRFRTPVTVTVLAGSARGFIIAWKYGRAVPSAPGKKAAQFESLINLWRDCTLQLRTDAYGKAEALVDSSRLQSLVEERRRKLLRWIDRQEMAPDARKAFVRQVNAIWRADHLPWIALGPLKQFFLLSGRTFERGKWQRYEDQMINPWNMDPFPCRAELHLSAFDPKKRLATIQWKQSIDAGKARAIVKQTAEELARRAEGRALPDRQLPRVDVQAKAEYRYDTRTGFPVYLRYDRTDRMGKTRTDVHMTITAAP